MKESVIEICIPTSDVGRPIVIAPPGWSGDLEEVIRVSAGEPVSCDGRIVGASYCDIDGWRLRVTSNDVSFIGDSSGYPQPELIVTSPMRRRSIVLDLDESMSLSIGRKSTNDVIVEEDKRVSGEHMLITCREGRHFVRDQRSTHGTRLNGSILQDETMLQDGDQIVIGETTIVYRRPAFYETRPVFDSSPPPAAPSRSRGWLRPDVMVFASVILLVAVVVVWLLFFRGF